MTFLKLNFVKSYCSRLRRDFRPPTFNFTSRYFVLSTSYSCRCPGMSIVKHSHTCWNSSRKVPSLRIVLKALGLLETSLVQPEGYNCLKQFFRYLQRKITQVPAQLRLLIYAWKYLDNRSYPGSSKRNSRWIQLNTCLGSLHLLIWSPLNAFYYWV